MDKLQKTFKSSYLAHLKDELRSQTSLPKYSEEKFEVDETQIRQLANLYQPKELLESIMPFAETKDDFSCAVALHEAFKNISPLLASQETFWAYLAHVDLFPYMKLRWIDKSQYDEVSSSYIFDHWFFGFKGMMRNGLASLWWSAYFSYDETRDNPYELTEVLFKDYAFRVNVFAIFLRVKNGLLGVLEFLKDNPHILSRSFRHRGRYLASYFNRLGAVRQLTYLPREFFYDECLKIKDTLELIDSEEDLKAMLGQS